MSGHLLPGDDEVREDAPLCQVVQRSPGERDAAEVEYHIPNLARPKSELSLCSST